jgi:hypothetical protein
MTIADFERLLRRAGYQLVKVYVRNDDDERRVYASGSRPRINVIVTQGEVDEYDALKVEAWLDEEGYFEDG